MTIWEMIKHIYIIQNILVQILLLDFYIYYLKTFNMDYHVDMPTSLSVKEDYLETNYPSDGNTFSQVYNYEAMKPITVHFGAALLLKSVNFFMRETNRLE